MAERSATEFERGYADGEVIVAQGSEGSEMYIVLDGEVQITRAHGGREYKLALLGRGEFFGEMSMLESALRDANAYAVGATRVLVIRAGGLMVRMRRDPTLAVEMLNRMSQRLRLQNTRLFTALEALHRMGEHTGEPVPEVLLYWREETA